MKKRQIAACILAALAGAIAGCGNTTQRGAAEHVAAAQTSPAVAVPVRRAVDQLTSDSPLDRAEALRQVVVAINRNAAEAAYIAQIAALIQRNIAAQIHELAQVEDPEARLRLAAVMAFNEALSHFAIDMLGLPPDQRRAMLAWGLDPKNVALIGEAWSGDPDIRVRGARDLAARPGPEPERLLARLIEDDDRVVALAAMDAAADRAPTAVLVDAVWKRAIEYPLRLSGLNMGFAPGLGPVGVGQMAVTVTQVQPNKMLNLHGRIVQINSSDTSYLRTQDGQFATEVLLDFNSPLVAAKLNDLFAALADGSADPNGYRFRMLSPNYGATSAFLLRLVNAYKPKAFVPCVMAMAAGNASDDYTQQMNNQSYRVGPRVDALGMLVQFTDQNKDDYGLTRQAIWGNQWMILGDEKQEDAAVKKLRVWWAGHYKDYGAKDAKLPEGGPAGRRFQRQGDDVIED